jgi:hypothetical protein
MDKHGNGLNDLPQQPVTPQKPPDAEIIGYHDGQEVFRYDGKIIVH